MIALSFLCRMRIALPQDAYSHAVRCGERCCQMRWVRRQDTHLSMVRYVSVGSV